MTAINDLLRKLDYYGWSQTIYLAFVWLTYLVIVVFLTCYRKHYKLSLKQGILIPAIAFPPAYLMLLVVTWAEHGFTDWGSNNIVRIFVLLPVVAAAASKITRIPFSTISDYIAPAMGMIQAFGHIVCPVAGCCRGYPCDWGVWNRQTGDYRFPNQWLECLVALGVVLACMRYAKRTGYDGRGRVYPLFLILFGSTRFLLEFLRDNEKLFCGISELALHAAFMVLVGSVWWILLSRRDSGRQKP